MMKQFTLLFLSIAILSFMSCSTCEDKVLQVNDYLLNWLPYTSDTEVSFTNQDGVTVNYNITPDVTTRVNEDEDCIVTTVQQFILLKNEDETDFMQIWFNFEEGTLGDREQLWTIVYRDNAIEGSGANVDIGDPDLISTSVSINGQVFNDVITIEVEGNGTVLATLYFQKSVGLVGFEYDDSNWLID